MEGNENGKSIITKDTLIPIGVIASLLGVAITFGMTLQRVSAIEKASVQIPINTDRLTRLETQFASIQNSLDKIERKLDTLK